MIKVGIMPVKKKKTCITWPKTVVLKPVVLLLNEFIQFT